MPWRDHPDPYVVWVSEIMLQQTQVDAVRGYFSRFIGRFPDLPSLAAADIREVLKLWEGLGYYSRARNLHRTARRVAASPGKALPRAAAALARLPGIGAYTSAAIASICFGEPVPAVDGNVIRVGARFLGWADDFRRPRERARLAAWLQPHILAARSAGDFNQALMELGAQVCTPRRPDCPGCPLRTACLALREGRQAELPFRKARPTAPLRHSAGARVRDARNRLLLVKRPEKGLLGGFWELPGGPVPGAPECALVAERVFAQTGLRIEHVRPAGMLDQPFTHFKQRLHIFDADRRSGRIRAHPDAQAAWCGDPATWPLTTACRRALGIADSIP